MKSRNGAGSGPSIGRSPVIAPPLCATRSTTFNVLNSHDNALQMIMIMVTVMIDAY